MRIIAGKWRSRKLVRPASKKTTRPMPDRVREAVFDILSSHYRCPGRLPPLAVADLFAGSGSMGLEALSRGARCCCFFERDRVALASLRKNIEVLGAEAEVHIITNNAWNVAVETPTERFFDLLLFDPPYADSDDAGVDGLVKQFLRNLYRQRQNSLLVVLHHRKNVRYTLETDEPWQIMDHRTFGSSAITMFQPR